MTASAPAGAPVRSRLAAPTKGGNAAPGDFSSVPTNLDIAAIAEALTTGDKLVISVKDGRIEAEKTGPDKFTASSQATAGVAGGVGNVLVNILNGTAGADPTIATLTIAQGANALMSSFNFIPSAVSAPFAANFYQYFRVFSPILSLTKLVNTWKASKAIAQHEHPEVTGTAAQHKASGKYINVAVDAAHLVLDIGVAAITAVFIANTFGAAIALPAFLPAWLDATHVLALGYFGDAIAGIFHGVGAAAQMSDAAHGNSFGERASRFMRENAGSSLFRRVFCSQEPLYTKDKPVVPLPPGPDVPPVPRSDENRAPAA